jgi:hypothetical protein
MHMYALGSEDHMCFRLNSKDITSGLALPFVRASYFLIYKNHSHARTVAKSDQNETVNDA